MARGSDNPASNAILEQLPRGLHGKQFNASDGNWRFRRDVAAEILAGQANYDDPPIFIMPLANGGGSPETGSLVLGSARHQPADGNDGWDELRDVEQLVVSDRALQLTDPEFRGNTLTSFSQDQSAITALADGGFVVTWRSAGQEDDCDSDSCSSADHFNFNIALSATDNVDHITDFLHLTDVDIALV